MPNRLFLLFIVCYVLIINATYSQSNQRPNVVIIITDDQGYGDLGFHGNEWVKTPNIDAFAKDARFVTSLFEHLGNSHLAFGHDGPTIVSIPNAGP